MGVRPHDRARVCCDPEQPKKDAGAMTISLTPLGAGQDVGRSCILLEIGGKRIMLDCGMHPGFEDERRFPDFKHIAPDGNYNANLDCIILSHFHLDHCGALPYFTEVCGFDGPVYMTHPTKAVIPILLEDYRKITVDRRGEKVENFFTSQHIKDLMRKIVTVNLHQTVKVDDKLEIRAYYAGHVLGAAMFYVRVGEESILYTGDYNMTPDRHLGAASCENLRPDILITESTYATTIRDSKRVRERDFLRQVHDAVERGGKVLIPVFALGRAQELCILLDTYWERVGLTVPIYFSAGLTEKANYYYKLFINWTNQKIKRTFAKRNMFEFTHIRAADRETVNLEQPGPCVLFATPGMLHAGQSLEMFKRWAPDERNLVIIPGYCVVGTVGNKVTSGMKGPVEIDRRTTVDVRCTVKHLSFSAHADAKGIMQLIKQVDPAHVCLVHGEKGKMQFLKHRIVREFGVPCFDPANLATVTIEGSGRTPVLLSRALLKRPAPAGPAPGDSDQEDDPEPEAAAGAAVVADGPVAVKREGDGEEAEEAEARRKRREAARAAALRAAAPLERIEVQGIVVRRPGQERPLLLTEEEALAELRLPPHALRLSARVPLPFRTGGEDPDDGVLVPSPEETLDVLAGHLAESAEGKGAMRYERTRAGIAAREERSGAGPPAVLLTMAGPLEAGGAAAVLASWGPEAEGVAEGVLAAVRAALAAMHASLTHAHHDAHGGDGAAGPGDGCHGGACDFEM
eukprot:tig00020911_g15729.t1